MHYFKRGWDESRGDEFDSWGTCTYYFETEDDMWPVRQMEVYANGTVLQYDMEHIEDKYGILGEAALDTDDFAPFSIAQTEFESAWVSHVPINR